MSYFYGTCHKCGKAGHSKKNCYQKSSANRNNTSFTKTIRCYDCSAMVLDLKSHRAECPSSRCAKSVITMSVDAKPACKKSETTDWYALIDVSGSMDGFRLESAKATLVNEIEPEMDENDRIAIVTFDSNAYFKLKPRPVGQIRRQGELQPLLGRIFARGFTALWDAVWLAVSQIRDKNQRTILTVLTDGLDNASEHTYEEVMALVGQYKNVSVSIVHVDVPSQFEPRYLHLCDATNGRYEVVVEAKMCATFTLMFKEAYQRSKA